MISCQRLPLPVRRGLRKWRRRLFGSTLQVVYHDDYDAALPNVPNDALRAERILAFLASEGLVLRTAVHRPEPVWLRSLERVHSADYLDRVHEPETLTSVLGSPVTRDQVDRLIDLQRLHTGGTLMAVRRARQRGLAVNLGGGFHHAYSDHGAGFCIFNDVAAAIADERRRGFRRPILVIDLDLHDGDGTRDFFRRDPSVHTFSIHARHWGDVEAVESTSLELGERVGDDTYLDCLHQHLPPLFARFRPGLVIYLAGCDPAFDDVMGDWQLSAEALLERDRLVAQLARGRKRHARNRHGQQRRGPRRRIPLCVLLAGGYSLQAWRYTARFLSDLERPGKPIEPPSTEEIALKRYRYISSLFDSAELSGAADATDNEFGLTEEDLYLPGWSQGRETRFLGFYTKHGMELVLERTGFIKRLQDLGFAHPRLEFQLDDANDHTLRVFGGVGSDELLVELRLRRDRRSLEDFELMSVEWLLMQNPRARFSPSQPRLPGQEHPGLGMLSDVVSLLVVACERLHLDGIIMVPSKFHIAAYGRSHIRFLEPEHQARFEALGRLLRPLPLAEATAALDQGQVIDRATGQAVRWLPAPMVLPVSQRLRTALKERHTEEITVDDRQWRLVKRGNPD